MGSLIGPEGSGENTGAWWTTNIGCFAGRPGPSLRRSDNGLIRLDADVRFPENAQVFVVVPENVDARPLQIHSPRAGSSKPTSGFCKGGQGGRRRCPSYDGAHFDPPAPICSSSTGGYCRFDPTLRVDGIRRKADLAVSLPNDLQLDYDSCTPASTATLRDLAAKIVETITKTENRVCPQEDPRNT
jgi:hypothetical protein